MSLRHSIVFTTIYIFLTVCVHFGLNSPDECRKDGRNCLAGVQCCSETCSSNYACGYDNCKVNWEPCILNPHCCSGYCIGFRCEDCREIGQACYFDSDCCYPDYCYMIRCVPKDK